VSALGGVVLALLAASGYGALLLSRLHDERLRVRYMRASSAHWQELAESRSRTIQRLTRDVIAGDVAVHIAQGRQSGAAGYARDMERYALDMQAQRDDALRRLAFATRREDA
jgi:hypothetical protein